MREGVVVLSEFCFGGVWGLAWRAEGYPGLGLVGDIGRG